MKNNHGSMRAFIVTGVLTCSCALAQVQAQEANPFGVSTALAHIQDSRIDTGHPVDFDSVRSAEELISTLADMEAELGPFDVRLGEPLLTAGDIFAENGDYPQALDFLERALHVTRINQGLYSEAQIAIVERLIDCHVAIEDWDAVDDNFRYLHLLYTRLYDKGSEQWNHGLAQISDWHIIALNNNLGSNMTEHLREANRLFRQRLSLAENAGDVDEHTLDVLRHNVDTTALHLRRKQQEEEGGLYTERTYSRMDMQNRDRESSIASLD